MTPTPGPLDTNFDRERDANMFQIVYLAKRPGYEFDFRIPTSGAIDLHGEQACFQVHFRDRHPGQVFMLELDVLKDFYESLSRLLDYVNIERQKSLRKYPPGAQHDISPTHG
jgi:hypothetical protein